MTIQASEILLHMQTIARVHEEKYTITMRVEDDGLLYVQRRPFAMSPEAHAVVTALLRLCRSRQRIVSPGALRHQAEKGICHASPRPWLA